MNVSAGSKINANKLMKDSLITMPEQLQRSSNGSNQMKPIEDQKATLPNKQCTGKPN